MPYSFKILFPGNPVVVTLCATTKTEADVIERALITLQADYVIVGPGFVGCSLRMTLPAHEILNRLAPATGIDPPTMSRPTAPSPTACLPNGFLYQFAVVASPLPVSRLAQQGLPRATLCREETPPEFSFPPMVA